MICPGGGYAVHATDHEGVQPAKYFNSIGVTAFVLRKLVCLEDADLSKCFEPFVNVGVFVRLSGFQIGSGFKDVLEVAFIKEEDQ